MGGASSTTLGASSTAEDVLQSVGTARVAGKHVLITGGSGGLGLESARVLAKGGAKVTITTRSEEQGRATVEKLATLGAPGVSYEVLLLDDLESVKACATRILARQQPLHVLLNNAGVMACPRSVTKQGLETQFGVNHVGHFLLTTLLLPLLASSGTPECKARVVNVSSMGAYLYAPAEGLFWDDLDGTKAYNKWTRYGQAKLCNVLFSLELNARCSAQAVPVESFALHPGAILGTDLLRHTSLVSAVSEGLAINYTSPARLSAMFLSSPKSVKQGAATQVLCCAGENLDPLGWYVDAAEVGGYLRHDMATSAGAAKRLWGVSEGLVRDVGGAAGEGGAGM